MTCLRIIATLTTLIATTGSALAHGQNIGACDPRQVRLGGEGGNAFTAVTPHVLAMRSGAYVDQLSLNGVPHGGNGGNNAGSFTLQDEEYINRMIVRHGAYVDRIELHTNFGRSFGAGGNGGNPTTLSNIRVLTLGGRSGAYLDQIEITYCNAYR